MIDVLVELINLISTDVQVVMKIEQEMSKKSSRASVEMTTTAFVQAVVQDTTTKTVA